MDFKNGKELLELCQRESLPISQVMRRRECVLGETTVDEVERRMTRALEIMRSSAMEPLKNPHRSMGGLIGGEAKRLAAHTAKKAKKHQRSVEAGGKIFRKYGKASPPVSVLLRWQRQSLHPFRPGTARYVLPSLACSKK